MKLIDFFKFHLAFLGFTCRVEKNKIILGFWLKDKFVEQKFNDWNEVVCFSRSVCGGRND